MKLSLVLAACGAVLSGCQTSPWRFSGYEPAPIETQLSVDPASDARARLLASVLGIARADGSAHVRLRIENLGTRPVRLVPETLSLVAADLVAFGPARVEPAPATIEPGQSATCEALFPAPTNAPGGVFDPRSLNLRLTLDFGGTPVTAGLTFQRVVPAYYDYDEPHWYFGVSWAHCYHH